MKVFDTGSKHVVTYYADTKVVTIWVADRKRTKPVEPITVTR